MYEPIEINAAWGGPQKLYRFPNGYGASVIQNKGSYGNEEGLWELAVIKFPNKQNNNFDLEYTTPITDDVIGRVNLEQVEQLLARIQTL